VETELWPNLLRSAGKRGIPVLIANGRISDRTLGRYRLVRDLVRQATDAVRLACVQSPLDAERFAAIGLPADRIRVTANIKFSRGVRPAADGEAGRVLADAIGAAPGDEIWIGGSTAEGEETALLAAFDSLPLRCAGRRLLVLAPRRPERFDRVAEILSKRGGAWRRRSRQVAGLAAAPPSPDLVSAPAAGLRLDAASSAGRPERCVSDTRRSVPRPAALRSNAGSSGPGPGSEVVLLDTLGELPLLYASATVAFVGGSLAPIGGHNLVEPAAHGVAPIFGPHIANARDVAARLLEAGGAFQIADAPGLAFLFKRLAEDPTMRARAGERARRVVEEGSGALDRTVVELLPFLANAVEVTA